MTHDVFLAGDLNEDHFHRDTRKERKMIEVMQEHNLQDLGTGSSDMDTYVNPHLGHASHIDHLLVKTEDPDKWSPAVVMERSDDKLALNMSTHFPVSTTLRVTKRATTTSKKSRAVPITTNKYKKKDCDIAVFKETMTAELTTKNLEPLDAHHAVNVFQLCIETATVASTPLIKPKSINKKKKPNDTKWTPEMKAAEKVAKEKFLIWKQ